MQQILEIGCLFSKTTHAIITKTSHATVEAGNTSW